MANNAMENGDSHHSAYTDVSELNSILAGIFTRPIDPQTTLW